MAKDTEWMRAVLEDVRAFCEAHDLTESEAAIRRAMEIAASEAANDNTDIEKARKH